MATIQACNCISLIIILITKLFFSHRYSILWHKTESETSLLSQEPTGMAEAYTMWCSGPILSRHGFRLAKFVAALCQNMLVHFKSFCPKNMVLKSSEEPKLIQHVNNTPYIAMVLYLSSTVCP